MHSQVTATIVVLTVVIQNLAASDWAVRVILVIKERLPAIADEFWGNCVIVSDRVVKLLLVGI